NEEGAEYCLMNLYERNSKLFAHHDVEESTDDRANERSEPTDERDEHGVEGPGGAEDQFGGETQGVVGKDSTGQASERAAHNKGQELVPKCAHPGGLGGVLVLAHRKHPEAETGAK